MAGQNFIMILLKIQQTTRKMLDFNPECAIIRHMAKALIKGFGISLLSLCLGLAFLSNDNLIGRLKSAPNKSLSADQKQISEVASSIFGSFDQEESKEKDNTDDVFAHESFLSGEASSLFAHTVDIELKNRSYILQDLYLSLPPPV
jgi:hypothetical protein